MDNNKYQDETPSSKEEKKRKKFLFLLLFLAFITSIITGFIIGRSVGNYNGQLIDTIVIGADQNRRIHVSGQVLYTNGTPYQYGKVELHSDPMTTETDERGRFFYESVAVGKHTLAVLNEEGRKIAECEFSINRNMSEEAINIKKADKGKYDVDLSVNVRFIELAIELDTESQELKLIPERTTVLEDDGTLTHGDTTLNVVNGPVILPSGVVVLPDKTVVIPDHLILPDNRVIPIPERGYTGENGEVIDQDGTIRLPDGTIITPNGIEKPDGTIISPDHPYQILPEEPGKDQNQANNNEDSSGSVEVTPVRPDDSVTDRGEFYAEEQSTAGWIDWESISTIDSFRNRFGTSDNGKIQPGSYGYYIFRLENMRQSSLQISLDLSEKNLQLPLEFTLTPLDQNGDKIISESVSGKINDGSLKMESTLTAETQVMYQLDWKWPEEGNDEIDTRAGIQAGTYLLSLQIRASEYI